VKITSFDLQSMGYDLNGNRIGDVMLRASKSAVREADLHDAILDFCRIKGWPVVHSRMDVPATCGVGTPDFVIAVPSGRTLWIEAKASGGKLRPEQSAWLASLRFVGHTAEVVRSMEEFIAVTRKSTT
jgi:hypothetical protein